MTNYPDPLVFVQKTARELGIPMQEGKTERNERLSRSDFIGNDVFYYEFPRRNEAEVYFSPDLIIRYIDNSSNGLYEPLWIKQDFLDYVQGKTNLEGLPFKDFDMAKHTMNELRRYRGNVSVSFVAERMLTSERDTSNWSRNVYVTAVKKKGGFVFESNDWKHHKKIMGSLFDWYKDVDETAGEDYRPYFRRTLEIIAGLPQDRWHDPRMFAEMNGAPKRKAGKIALNEEEKGFLKRAIEEKYGSMDEFNRHYGGFEGNINCYLFDITRVFEGKRTMSSSLADDIYRDLYGADGVKIVYDDKRCPPFLRDIIYKRHPAQLGLRGDVQKTGEVERDELLETTLSILFTEQEGKELGRRINEARLQMRGSWGSVPRLSLGAIQIPNPGQKDVRTDEFVVNASSYLVESLSHFGIMSSEEAEEMIARRLQNYFVHKGGFQLNRERAAGIVSKLQGRRVLQEAV